METKNPKHVSFETTPPLPVFKIDRFIKKTDSQEEKERVKEAIQKHLEKHTKYQEDLDALAKDKIHKKLIVNKKTGLSNESYADPEVHYFHVTLQEWNEIISGKGYILHIGNHQGSFVMKPEVGLKLYETEILRRELEQKERDEKIKREIQLNFINRQKEKEKILSEQNAMDERSEIEKTVEMMKKLNTPGQEVHEMNALANGESAVPWSLDLYKHMLPKTQDTTPVTDTASPVTDTANPVTAPKPTLFGPERRKKLKGKKR